MVGLRAPELFTWSFYKRAERQMEGSKRPPAT